MKNTVLRLREYKYSCRRTPQSRPTLFKIGSIDTTGEWRCWKTSPLPTWLMVILWATISCLVYWGWPFIRHVHAPWIINFWPHYGFAYSLVKALRLQCHPHQIILEARGITILVGNRTKNTPWKELRPVRSNASIWNACPAIAVSPNGRVEVDFSGYPRGTEKEVRQFVTEQIRAYNQLPAPNDVNVSEDD